MVITFLGIEINTEVQTSHLPLTKLSNLRACLWKFMGRKKTTFPRVATVNRLFEFSM